MSKIPTIGALPLRLLILAIAAILFSGCENRILRQKTLTAPPAASARVKDIIKELDFSVGRVRSAPEAKLTTMAETFDWINECFDELQGKNKTPAPSPQEWGDISADTYNEVLPLLADLENDAEMCRDLARAGKPRQLKSQWNSFWQKYTRLASLLAPPNPQ